MNLSVKDADLYFHLTWEVLFYANNRLGVIKNVKTVDAYKRLSQENKMKARELFYQNIGVLDDFVKENPANFSADELKIVQSWKGFIQGKFYIFKFLKKYTIFVSADSDDVYGVLGLYDSLEDIFQGYGLPVMVQAVLLPFKGHVIYDGLISSYPIFFGANIKRELNESYMRAKQNQRIIDTLDPKVIETQKQLPKKQGPDYTPMLDNIVKTSKKLRQADTIIQTKAYGVLKASALLAQATANSSTSLDELYKLAQKTDRALAQLWKTLDRAE